MALAKSSPGSGSGNNQWNNSGNMNDKSHKFVLS